MKDCPICHQPLRETPRYGVIIDVCPSCRGVWLDRGELDKVVALAREFHSDDDFEERRSGHEEKPYREHYDREHYDDYHGYRHKKKKKHGIFEVFGDLFD